ncbi:MAG: PHP domain-containing protein [Syntrophomonas sp.]|nr:PHP domain-containing protein [Syntrophomonas sp.]
MIFDLHVHTSASDGVNTPEQVVLKAVDSGLTGLAITDHDTVDGLETAQRFIESNRFNIEFIPGIELNTDSDEDDLHILGYYINYYDEHLINRLMEVQAQRRQRAEQIVNKLQAIGLDISFEQVKNMTKGDLIGRPHIARAIHQAGYALSAREAFQEYIARDMPGYVKRYKFTPGEAIELIKKAGGISVLAHPGLIKNSYKINEIIKLGIEGIEAYYPEHSSTQIQEFIGLAQNHNLLITGGSDFHGEGSPESRNHLGSAFINEVMFKQIREYYKYKK